ncbi:hypothetical protein MHB42_01855 [Lysinibacillus sp. FSL K6-0232]|uniref:hypothetical protein n=1 Tax=Lysinibacillus sp. FSL K6-0232 TaxID=2921425 RepID=UPI0030FC634C
MDRTGSFMSVELKHVHLNWGTTSNSGTRRRDEFEVYIPIPIDDARRLELRRGLTFYVNNQEFKLRASGSQAEDLGKNFESDGNLKLLGRYLKIELGAQPGDIVTIYWESNTEVSITLN